MGIRRTLLWPVYRVAGWADSKPLSAAGVVVALGALLVLVASVGIGAESGGGALVYEGLTLSAVADTAVSQPAYVIAAVAGLAMFLFYDG